jgi:autotransporter-associated beta strand protein
LGLSCATWRDAGPADDLHHKEITVFYRHRSVVLSAALLTVGLLLANRAQAQTSWVGDTSQDWNNALNWAGDVDPTGNFLIDTATGNFPIYSADGFFTPVDIIIGSAAGAAGRLDQTGGNLATGPGNWLIMGSAAGSSGTFNLSGGTFTGAVHMARIGGAASTATINVSNNAVLTSPDVIVVSDGQNVGAVAQGTFNMTGGAVVNSENDLIVAWAGGPGSFGEMNVGAGTTYNLAQGVTKRWLIVNTWDSQQGRLNVAGTINLGNVTDLRFSTGNGIGTSHVTLSGNGQINMQAGSELDFNRGSNVNVNNTFNLDGGTLTTGRIMRFNTGAGGTRVFNFNGGTVKPAASITSFFDANVVTAANVRNGGAKFDTAGFDISVAQTLQHSNVGGDNAIDGGLTKSGAGTLTLTTNTHTYTGPTLVNGGTLNVAAGLNTTGGITAATGGTFSGAGTVAGTVTLSGGALGNSSTTTPLTVGAVNVTAPSSLRLNLGAGPGVAVTGAYTTNGNLTTINANKPIWTNGTQSLITYGSLSGSAANFAFAPTGLNARQSVSGPLSVTGTGISATIVGDNPKWTGLENGNWVIGTTGPGAATNWQLVIGGTATDYINNDAVVFDDSAGGTTTVDIVSAGGVTPSSVTFNNTTSKAYTINSASGGGIAGSTTIVKNNTGVVTLNTANTHTGGTTLDRGTLNMGNAAALGTGPLTIGPGNGTAAGTVLGNTSGGDIIATANQTQTWNGDFTFAGPNSLDMGIGNVTMGGAGTNRTIAVSGTATLAVGELTAAAHGLIKTGTGTLAFTSTGPNTNGSVINGTLDIQGGTVQMNRTGNGNFDVDTGDLYVGGLTGTGTVTNGAAIVRWLFVNQVSGTSVFNGAVENGGTGGMGLFKDGPGTLTLGGVSGMTDRLTIAGGTLNFTGSGSVLNSNLYDLLPGSGVFQVDSASRIGSANINIISNGNAPAPGAGSTGRLEISNNTTLFNAILLQQRNDTNGSDAIRSVSGANQLGGQITIAGGGNQARIRSDLGSTLTLSGGITTTSTTTRNLYLQGAGNGEVSGAIADLSGNPAGNINVWKEGAGTWILSGFNTYTGTTGVFAGTLRVTQADVLADTADVSIMAGSTLNLTSGTTDTIDSLYLNGISQLPGVYGAGNSGGLITGSGSLNVLTYDLPGDFDNNNIVNGDDLVVWRGGVTNNNATGDTNGDGRSDGRDFLIWQRFLGATYTPPAVAATAAVPEPATLISAMAAAMVLVGRARRRA